MTQWRGRRQKENTRKTKAEGKQKPPLRGRRGVTKRVVSFAHLLYINCANKPKSSATHYDQYNTRPEI